MSGTDLQKWGSYDVDTAAAEQEVLEKERGSKFMKLEVGKNTVRILPPAPGAKSPFQVIFQHYCTLPDGSRYSFACPRVMAKARCPVCLEAAKLARSKNKADLKRSRELTPKRRVFCAVLDRRNEDLGPQILGFGKKIHGQLVALRQDEDMGGDYTHPTKGIDVVIDRVGTGQYDTDYTVNLARRSRPIVDDAKLMDEIREMLPDLSALARVPDEEEIITRLAGEEYERNDRQHQRSSRGARRQSRAQDSFSEDDAIDAEFEEVPADDDGWDLKG